ncbi:MAG: sulfurtransferase [Thermomicrobiales bacterium]
MESIDHTNPAALVETAWVAQHGRDPGVRLVEVDVDTAAYETGHILNAIGWDSQLDLQRRPMRDIPTRTEWESLLGRSGIANDTLVVLYGDHHNWFAAFAYWLLKLYGHEAVAIMNGGRAKWIEEGRAFTTEAPRVPPARYQAMEADGRLRAFRDDVMAAIAATGVALVDVRSPAEFSGELLAPANLPQEGAQRGGHIPGAHNVPWATAANEDGTFKSAAELRAIYGGSGHHRR